MLHTKLLNTVLPDYISNELMYKPILFLLSTRLSWRLLQTWPLYAPLDVNKTVITHIYFIVCRRYQVFVSSDVSGEAEICKSCQRKHLCFEAPIATSCDWPTFVRSVFCLQFTWRWLAMLGIKPFEVQLCSLRYR